MVGYCFSSMEIEESIDEIISFNFFINSSDYEVLALVTQRAKAQNRGKKIVERNITKIAKENKSTVVLS